MMDERPKCFHVICFDRRPGGAEGHGLAWWVNARDKGHAAEIVRGYLPDEITERYGFYITERNDKEQCVLPRNFQTALPDGYVVAVDPSETSNVWVLTLQSPAGVLVLAQGVGKLTVDQALSIIETYEKER